MKSLDFATHFVHNSEAKQVCSKLNKNARPFEQYYVKQIAGWDVIAIYIRGVFAGYC